MLYLSLSWVSGCRNPRERGPTPLTRAHDPHAEGAEDDVTALDPICHWPGIVCRAGVSRAREVQTMRAQVTLQPGQKGTKKLLAQYGDQLVCVRYRDDSARRRRLKTVE